MTADIQEFDGVRRCWWPGEDAEYLAYHDREWGRPIGDDDRLFERLSLEGFQSGLSWLTILRKRENFRRAFRGFDIERVARFGPKDVNRLLGDAGIVRHRGKIEATIHNASRVGEIRVEFGSFGAYLWRHEPEPRGRTVTRKTMPGKTDASTALAKELKNRGFRFCGPTTVYSLMQAVGMVNDHVADCAFRDAVETARRRFVRPT